MNTIFQVQNAQQLSLSGSKLNILSKNISNSTILIFDCDFLLFREYLIISQNIQTVTCDPNLQILLIFEEQEQEQVTKLYSATLEQSFTPFQNIKIPAIKLRMVDWCNSRICALIFEKYIILYDILLNKILTNIQAEFNQINRFLISKKLTQIFCQYQEKDNNSVCLILAIENQIEVQKFNNCVSCQIIQEQEDNHFLMVQYKTNSLIIMLAKFDEEFRIEKEIKQNLSNPLQGIIKVGYQRKKQALILLDQNQNLYIYSINSNFQITQKIQNIPNIIQFNISLLNENLIILDNKNQLILKEMPAYQQIRQSQLKQSQLKQSQLSQPQTLSLASQVKKRAIQGILTDPNILKSTEHLIQQYESDFYNLSPKFKNIINLNFSYRFLPLVDFRILNLNYQENSKFKELIPKMDTYAETQSVKNHLKQLEAALKGDNPILCEGSAACGKTSIIQYLAYKNQQPLIIMNLSSFTQISDFIGKVEILPGFKFEFQLGPFAKAVQDGLWILLDEANLASDSILRVIEDVLEIGYITIYGSSINSHEDLVDGTLTIRKHQNFKLFLTQNPATDSQFAASRNIFSPSLMSQFISIKFEPMSLNDLNFIIDQIIDQKQQELNEQLVQEISTQQLSSLIMIIYEEIKQKNMDDGLFTLRDIVQMIDLYFLSVEQTKEQIFEILPLNDCMKLISTQFIYLQKYRDIINYQIDNNQLIANTNMLFVQTKDYRESYIQNWNINQPLKFLSFHKYLFPMLTLCYKTKRAALIVGQQYCGKLSSVLIWLKILNIQQYEVLELSSSTTTEDLFGKYQPTQNGFDFILGPVTRCFHQGKVLILTNFDAPDCALTESLNGILEKKFNQLLVQNQRYQRHQDFAIIALSSDFQQLEKKITPTLKSRFLSLYIDFKVNLDDITLLFQQIRQSQIIHNINQINEKLMTLGSFKTSQNLGGQIDQISLNKIIRFLKPILESEKYSKSQFNQKQSQINFECLDFFIALSLQDNKSLFNQNIAVPIHYQELLLNDGKQNNFVITESRKRVADIIAFAIIAKIPLVLQGSAGVGKTKIISTFQQTCKLFESTSFHYINMNQNTDINDLMGQFQSTCEKDKIKFILKKGPLFLGMEQGGIVLIDEANLSDASILNFLANIAKYPSEFHDPVSNQIIKVHEKFRIFFAQNPPSYNGRNQLPETLASKTIIVEVPNYTFEEVLKICTESQPSMQNQTQTSIQKAMEYFLTKLIPYPKNGDEKQLYYNGTQFSLRQFIKFRNRLEKTSFSTNQPNWENILQLHQMILFPKDISEEYSLECDINKIGLNLYFTIKNQQAQIEISLIINKNYSKYVIAHKSLNPIQRLVLCKIAFCYYFKENILIVGETSSKTYLTKLFTQLVQFQNPQPFELIYINSQTEITDLIGSMESHNLISYQQYCLNLIKKLNYGKQINFNLNEKPIQNYLQELIQKYNQPEFFNHIIQNIGNQFHFVERGLTFNARFGGVVCLKNISLAEQSVIEGLNSLLEIESHFIVNGQEIKLHNEFFVIAIMNTTFGGQLSDALQSRLTKIRIQVPQIINYTQELDISYKKYILNKFPQQTQFNQIIQYIQNLLIQTKEFKEFFYQNISDRKIYQWMSFLNLDLDDATYQQKLALGFQFVILDKFKVNFEEVVKNPDLHEHYKEAQNKIQQKLKVKQFFNSPKIIINPTTNKILQRIYSAITTQYIPCLVGPPGVGKSAIAQEFAKIMKQQFCRVCCSDSLSAEDLFGSYAPKIENNKVSFVFQEGYLAQALVQNSLILFDEINLASPEILSTLQALFNTDEKEITIKDSKYNKEKCLFLCSMNPSTYQGRQELPQCISNLLCEVYIEAFDTDQVIGIFQQRYQNEIIQLKNSGINFKIILDLHKELAILAQQQYKSNYDFNIRFLENLLQLFNQQFLFQRSKLYNNKYELELIIVCLDIIYVQHFYQTEFSNQVLNIILNKFGVSQEEWNKRKVFLEQSGNIVRISRQIGKQFKSIFNWVISNQIIPQLSNNSLVINLQNSNIFEKLLIAINSKKIILCQGDVSSGKTSCIIKMANLLNQRFILLQIHSDLETDDLLGSYALVNTNYDQIQKQLERISIKSKFGNLNVGQQQKQMNMKYVEGVLKICCKFGYWLILDNINLARAEIVERLNSLGEDQPCLYNNEFGDSNTCIIPHNNFRLICLQNPTRVDQNQLSPAFYNRCIKINFEIDLKKNFIDIIEILTIRGFGQQFIQQDTVVLANNLLKQVIFIKEHTNALINLRNIIKAFKMIQQNGFQFYDQIMEIVFGPAFNESKKNPYFPIFDLKSLNVADSIMEKYTDLILNKLVSNSVKRIVDQPNKLIDLQNISQFLKIHLSEQEIQNYQRFIQGIGQQIQIVNMQEEDQYDLGCYKIRVKGELIIQLYQQTMTIQPLFLSIYINNKELQNLLLKSKCIFQDQNILAEAKLNSEGKLQVQLQQSKDFILVPMIKSLIGPSYEQFFKTFQNMLSKSDIECSIYLDQQVEIFFNFNLSKYTLSFIPNLKLKNISGQIALNKDNIYITQFSINFDLQLELNKYFIKKGHFSRVDNLNSLRGIIKIPKEDQIYIFQDQNCFHLFSNIDIIQSHNFASFLDLKESRIEINLECENPIQIYKLPFSIRINRILANILLQQKITLNGSIQCSFHILQNNICNLTALIDKTHLKLQLSNEQHQNNCQNFIKQIFLKYYDHNNFLIQQFVESRKATVKKLDLITNALYWHFELIFELNWNINIFKNAHIEIENMNILCHIDSQTTIYTMSCTIEILKFIFEIEIVFDFESFFSQEKNRCLAMIFKRGKNSPMFKEIINAFSSDLKNQLQIISGFNQLKTIQFQRNEGSQQLFDFDNFKKQGEQLNQQFEDEVHQIKKFGCNEYKLRFENFQSDLKQKIDQELKLNQQQNMQEAIIQKLTCSQESYIIWSDQVELKFNVDLLNPWIVSKILTLCQCNLNVEGKNQIFELKLNGLIKFMNMTLNRFQLQLTPNRPLDLKIENEPLIMQIHPISFGFGLFGQQFEDIGLLPKLDQIIRFNYNIISQQFYGEFKVVKENIKQHFVDLSLENIQLQFSSSDNLKNVQAILEMKAIFFKQEINFYLQFLSNTFNESKNSSLQLKFNCHTIKNFCLNEFLKNSVGITLTQKKVEFNIENFEFLLILQKTPQWHHSILLQIKNSQCTMLQNYITLKNLNGQLVCKQQSWMDSCISGICLLKDYNIGSFNLVFNKEVNGLEAKFQLNPKFQIKDFLSTVFNQQMNFICFQNVRLDEIKVFLGLYNNKTIFELKYEVKMFSWNCIQAIKLKNIFFIFSLSEENQIEKKSNLQFELEIFNNIKLSTKVNIDLFQLNYKTEFHFELQNINLIYLIEKLNQNYQLKIPQYEFFNDINLNLICKLTMDQNFNFKIFSIESQKDINSQWHLFKIQNFQLKSIQENNFHTLNLTCNLTIFDIPIILQYDQNKQVFIFKKLNNQISAEQIFSYIQQKDQSQLLNLEYKDFSITKKELQIIDLNIKQQNIIFKLIEHNHNINLYLNQTKLSLIFQYQFENYKTQFKEIIENLSELDQIFQLEKADCLIIYSSKNDLPFVTEINLNKCYQNYLNFKQKGQLKRTGFSCFANCTALFKQQLQQILFFIPLNIDLDISYQFETHFLVESKQIHFQKGNFQSVYQFRKKLLSSISQIELQLKYSYHTFGYMVYDGIFQFENGLMTGKFDIAFKKAFGQEQFNFLGTNQLQFHQNNLTSVANLNAKIYAGYADLIIFYYNHFIPKTWAFNFVNINLQTALEFFKQGTIFPKEFFQIFSKANQIIFINGQIDQNSQNYNFPNELMEKFGNSKFFSLLQRFDKLDFSKFKIEFDILAIPNILFTQYRQVFIMIETREQGDRFSSCCLLYNNENQYLGKGEITINIPNFIFNIMFDIIIEQKDKSFIADGDFQIKLFQECIKTSAKYKKGIGFNLNFKISLNNMFFIACFDLLLMKKQKLRGLLKFNVNKLPEMINKQIFLQFCKIRKFEIQIRFDKNFEVIFEYKIQFFIFKQFSLRKKIQWNICQIQENFDMVIQKIQGLLSIFDQGEQIKDEKSLKEKIYNKKQQFKDYYSRILNLDISGQIDQIHYEMENINQKKDKDLRKRENQQQKIMEIQEEKNLKKSLIEYQNQQSNKVEFEQKFTNYTDSIVQKQNLNNIKFTQTSTINSYGYSQINQIDQNRGELIQTSIMQNFSQFLIQQPIQSINQVIQNQSNINNRFIVEPQLNQQNTQLIQTQSNTNNGQTLQAQTNSNNTQLTQTSSKTNNGQTLQAQTNQKNTQLKQTQSNTNNGQTLQSLTNQNNTQLIQTSSNTNNGQILQAQTNYNNTQLTQTSSNTNNGQTLQAQTNQNNTQLIQTSSNTNNGQTLQAQTNQNNNQLTQTSSNTNNGQTLQVQTNQNNTQLIQTSSNTNNGQTLQAQTNQNNTQLIQTSSNTNNGQILQAQTNQNNTQLTQTSSNTNNGQTLQVQTNQNNNQLTQTSSNTNNGQTLQVQTNQNNTQLIQTSSNTNNGQTLQAQTNQNNTQLIQTSSNTNNGQILQAQTNQNNTQLTQTSSNTNNGQTLQVQTNQNNNQLTQTSSNTNNGQTLQAQTNQNNTQSIQTSSNTNNGQILQAQTNQNNTQLTQTSSNTNNGQTLQAQTNQNNTQLIQTSSNTNNGQTLQAQTNQNNTQLIQTSSNTNNGQILQAQTNQNNTQLIQTLSNTNNGQILQAQTNQNNTQLIQTLSNTNNGQILQAQTNQNNTQLIQTSSNTNNGQILQAQTNQNNTQLIQTSSNTNNGQTLQTQTNSNNTQLIQTSSNTNNGQTLQAQTNSNNTQLTQTSSNTNNGQILLIQTNQNNNQLTQTSSNTNNGQTLQAQTNSNNTQLTQTSSNTNNGQTLQAQTNSNNTQLTQTSSNTNNGQTLQAQTNSNNTQLTQTSSNTNNGQILLIQTNQNNSQLTQTSSNTNNGQTLQAQTNQNNTQLIQTSSNTNNGQTLQAQTNSNNTQLTQTSSNTNNGQTLQAQTNSNNNQLTLKQHAIRTIDNNSNSNQNIQNKTIKLFSLFPQIFLSNVNGLFDDYFNSNIYYFTKIRNLEKENHYFRDQFIDQHLKEDNCNQRRLFTQYNQLIQMAENQLYLYWRYYTKPYVSINQLSFRIIIIDQYVDQQFLQDFGQLLLQLSFLNMNYDLILSGQNQPIFLKQKDETLTIDLLDKILHALIGKCNQDFILVKEKAQNNNDFVLLFTKQLFEMSIICKIELQNEGLNTIILFQDQNHFNTIDIKNGQIINSSNNIFELLIQIQQQSSVLKQQMFYNHQEKEELKKKIFRLDYQIDQKEANSLRGLLEINKFTKYSLSSKGTTIDIKGIIKFFCTNGTARDILRRKNRGGKSLYLFEVVLDLSSMSKAILLEIVQPFLYQLIAICKECQIICNLAILNNALIIIKSNFSTTWTDYEYSLLTQHLIDNCDQVSTNSNVKVFQYILDQFEKFIHYKKFLIFINHSFYNYQYQELSQKINLAQQKQIKIVSLGVDIKKYINRSIEGVIQYSLCQSQNLYIILKKLFTKVLDFENLNQVFQFQQNINQYPRKLQLLKFSSTDIQINCYLNKYFNYRIDDIQDEGFERIPFFKVDPLLFHILMLENEIKRLQNLINRQPIEKQNK